MKLEMMKVCSSAIKKIGYNNGVLAIKFYKGNVYLYPNVPEQLFKDFLNANSKGKFYNEKVKDK